MTESEWAVWGCASFALPREPRAAEFAFRVADRITPVPVDL